MPLVSGKKALEYPPFCMNLESIRQGVAEGWRGEALRLVAG